MAYTVDEVSDLMGVPRPTLYRYLREYSIPHLRRSGKIYVPEESFDRIKEVRELHREGLGTESVRRRLQEESTFDVEELTERLDRISEALEGLRGDLKPANEASSAKTLQTILERQSLLISAVSNLAERIENLPYTNGGHRKVTFDPEEETQKQEAFLELLEERPETIENALAADEPFINTPQSTKPPAPRRKKFGAMARRRRRGALAVLLVLLTSAALVAYATLSSEEGSGASQEESSAPSQEETTTGPEETTAVDVNAATSGSAAYEAYAGHAKEGYEDPARERTPYQRQYPAQGATSGLPSQGEPVLQPPSDNTGLPHPTFGNDGVRPVPGAPTP